MTAMSRLLRTVGAVTAATIVAACSFAPHYQVPPAPPVSTYKEGQGSAATGAWSPAQPADGAARGEWWVAFNDPDLDALERQAFAADQDVAAAAARYREAHAIADQANASLFPIIGVASSASRDRVSANSPTNTTHAAVTYNDFQLGAQTSYELDFWGHIRNTVAAARGRAQASAADLQTALLSIQSEVAADYIQLHGLDAQVDLLRSTVADYEAALQINERLYRGGAAAAIDVDQAQTQLETARVQLADTTLSRAQMEHAIAVLVDKPASLFSLSAAPLHMYVPAVAPGLPSQLLERRPDVASAERQMFAANAEIGVARAAWFPTFTLNADFGYDGDHLGNWFSAPSQMWSVGPSAMENVIDWGQRAAQNRQAKASFDEALANYRKAVVTAYSDVEDQLAAIRWLDAQLEAQRRAVESSQRLLEQANYRYHGGISTYLEVVTAQNAALQARQAELNLRVRRLDATVQLMKALGGGWSSDQLQHPVLPPVLPISTSASTAAP
jgi:NodT family efflux transporter outer membrane factor (OMF) lipoprotein